MLNTLIEIEKNRLIELGYTPVVTMEDIIVTENNWCKSIGNDTLIITGFVFDTDTTSGDRARISVSSATDCICGDATELSAYGKGTYKILRGHISVSRQSESANNGSAEPLTINVIKITPKRR